MANSIPKIEYKNNTITGTLTLSSATITAISDDDLDLIDVGMVITGTGIPTETTVLSKGVNEITISNQATVNGATSLEVFVEILFQYPPQGLDFVGKSLRAVQKVSEATNGNYQISDNYVEQERNLRFRQVRQAIEDQLALFMRTHALRGFTFKYFISNDEPEFENLQVSKRGLRYRPKRTGWNSTNEFTYEIRFRFRKVD